MKVKVCGITNIEDALMCQKYGADALGFIFFKKSKRYIEPGKAAEIINSLSPFLMKVGVFVNESADEINKITKLAGLNSVQLHGDENEDYIKSICLPVIRAFRINDNFDFASLLKLKANYFLLDSFSKDEYGGTGKKFDWNRIPLDIKSKIILAGGVSIDNIEEIYKTFKPAAVDLSSSLELKPGKKDEDKVKAFFKRLNDLKGNLC